ncbi:hypothetical protein D0Z07_8748 [Hyphodiscus hymeniophilus]|uniref:Uncharacterized protein n=1 Tax=Hyphodiscus hymeniophilus TaxID=353542 RepID=A0A9P6VE44_9HELO|nr:hypothetical protein D0Z07_8748 [Hyphodiscus hymeniophilus]
MSFITTKRSFSTLADSNGSSSEPTAKKPRSESPILDKITLWNMITALPNATTQSLLFQICHDDPSVSHHVQSAHNERLAAERARPAVNFDAYSRSCWSVLNKEYKRASSSRQFEAIGDICEELEMARTSILEQAHANTKWETRRNALEVLRKISKSIMLCDEQLIRHELMKDGLELGYFAEAMAGLARGMTEAERERYKEEGLYEKLVDLQTVCDWESEMEGLREVFEIFDGEEDGEGGEEEGGDSEGDDEGSDDSVVILDAPPPPQRTKVFSVTELT